jgi:hypothetical protein
VLPEKQEVLVVFLSQVHVPCRLPQPLPIIRSMERHADRTKLQLLTEILLEFEEAGYAMRYLNSKGQIAWKATPRMLAGLANAEQEARDDAEHDLF